MADELNENAEFGGKHKDEEDPILVAQRYLNIYHQIHIFNKERQNEFDDSLLTLSSDIRILLSTLPGGSLLLDHITELEENRGIISLMSQMDEKTTSKRSKASKKKTQEEIAQEFSSTPVISATESSDNAGAKSSNDGPNLSSAILKMLKQSEDKHDRDMKTLTEAFLQSQENMANVLKEVLTETRQQQQVISQPAVLPQQAFVSQPAFPQQEQPAYLQPLPEDENPIETRDISHSKPKLFSFTKKLFTSHKAAGTARDIDRPLNPFVDNTPVSLDEIESDPVALDDEHKDVVQNQDLHEDTPPAETASENSDWDWEYVDENASDEAATKVNDDVKKESEDEDEWEYIEVPEDEQTQVADHSAAEELNEEKTQETIIEEAPVQEPVNEEVSASDGEQGVQDVLKDIEKQISDTPDESSSPEQPDAPQTELSETSEESLYQDNFSEQETPSEPQAFEDSAFTYDETPEYEPGLESYQEPVFYNQEQADQFLNPQEQQDDWQDSSSSYQVFDESAPLEYGSSQDNADFQDDYVIADDQEPFVYDDSTEPLPENEALMADENVNPLPQDYVSENSLEDALSGDEKSELYDAPKADTDIDTLLDDFVNEVNNNADDEETTKKSSKKGKSKNKKATEE